jgi:hypothetical protein
MSDERSRSMVMHTPTGKCNRWWVHESSECGQFEPPGEKDDKAMSDFRKMMQDLFNSNLDSESSERLIAELRARQSPESPNRVSDLMPGDDVSRTHIFLNQPEQFGGRTVSVQPFEPPGENVQPEEHCDFCFALKSNIVYEDESGKFMCQDCVDKANLAKPPQMAESQTVTVPEDPALMCGYHGRRHVPGCANCHAVERIAKSRAETHAVTVPEDLRGAAYNALHEGETKESVIELCLQWMADNRQLRERLEAAEQREHVIIDERDRLESELELTQTERDRLKEQLAEMTEDRDLWQGDHNDDCPNLSKVAELEGKLATAAKDIKALISLVEVK